MNLYNIFDNRKLRDRYIFTNLESLRQQNKISGFMYSIRPNGEYDVTINLGHKTTSYIVMTRRQFKSILEEVL